MKATSVMSLVAATVLAVGVVAPAVAQTPAPAPAAPKSGDMQMDKTDKMDKKSGKPATKHSASKKKPAAKATKKKEGSAMTPAPDTKAVEQPKK